MAESKHLIGIDLGTSGLKASVFDETGNLLGQAYRQATYLPGPAGHMEQRPEQWRDDMYSALREVLALESVKPGEIAGIGICGLQHCPVFLDKDGNSSRSVIQLHDQRLARSREELAESGVLGRIEKSTRSMVSAAHFPPIFHYVEQHDPDGLGRTRWILLAKDYLRFTLTGEIGTEICDASGTNLIGAGESDWSTELCDILSVPIECLPPISLPTDTAGELSKAAAEASGLPAGTPVVYGGGDSHCALLGLGCIDNGDTGLLLGTNSTLRTVFDRFVSHPEIKLWGQRHIIPGRHTISASSMAGASVVNWFRESFFSGDAQGFDDLEKAAGEISVGSEGLTFLPYVHGERCPFYDPDAAGAFMGIKPRHEPVHFLRSIIEGLALNIANCSELIEECAEAGGTGIGALRLGGGGSRATLRRQVISDCLNKPIRIMRTEEAGTLGAAMLAGIGANIYTDCRQAIVSTIVEQEIIEPNAERHAAYIKLKNKFNALHRRIQ
ncbi:FGGY-family carbohydrate kinase [Candidatus Hydrogenedentota bacterium]